MEKNYLLLRNNLQSGPFTKMELAEHSICSNDLIWIVGHSTGWRFVEEIEELQSLQKEHSLPGQESSTMETHQKLTHSSRIFVSLPEEKNSFADKKLHVEEPSFEERVEKVRLKIASIPETKPVAAVTTNYSRPLEEIKAEYSSWLQTQKRSDSVKVLQYLGFALLLVFVATLSFIGIKSLMAGSKTALQASKEVRQDVKHPIAASHAANPELEPEEEKNQYPVVAKTSEPLNQKTGLIKKQVLEKPLKGSQSTKKDIPVARNPAEGAQRAVPAGVPIATQIHLKADYIITEKTPGLGGLAVTLTNGSQQFLKLVAVDVIYYEDLDHELMRKTLYFTDVKPGEKLNRVAPAHKTAKGAYARLGLISSESGNLFYAKTGL